VAEWGPRGVRCGFWVYRTQNPHRGTHGSRHCPPHCSFRSRRKRRDWISGRRRPRRHHSTQLLPGPGRAVEEPYVDTDGSGDFDYVPSGSGDALVPEPFCDANGNGRWDGIYSSGGVDHLAKDVHDPIDARAIAISRRSGTVVIVSVVAQGIFKNYIDQARAEAETMRPGISDVIVSADHNESSPDTIGIYGAPPAPEDVPVLGGAVGLHSGIDDYYMKFLVDRIAEAAVRAYDRRQPATLWARSVPLPPNVRVQLSKNFPTTDDAGQPAAIDPNLRVLQARDARGHPIATVLNLAAHNQEIGHSSDPALQDDLSADWPGYFASKLEADVGGMAMFLVADNGSEEDPQSVPAVRSDPAHDCPDGCYAQAQATGEALAADTATAASGATQLRPGPVTSARREFFVPLENNLFAGAAALGLFGDRQLYTAGQPTGRAGHDLQTEVGLVDVGPDLQILANPGEAFPALMLGSPWGIEDAGCPERPNPPVPTWRAPAEFRFQAGLADDMIGYEIPAWAYSSLPGALDYDNAPATCFDDTDDRDPAGHQHKLETEGVGATGSNLVASNLADLVDSHPDRTARVVRGRYLFADGTTSRTPTRSSSGGASESAVAIWLAPDSSTSLGPGDGRIVALQGIRSFGSTRVDAHGQFMDFDGQPQAAPDITTRGMLVGTARHPRSRNYLDLYPALTTGTLPPARPKR
jgi:hypothetical protein